MASALSEFGSEIWIADGPTVTAALGFYYPTRMVVIRLPDRGLWICSPVQLSDSLRRELAVL